jgi:hypothetical protein
MTFRGAKDCAARDAWIIISRSLVVIKDRDRKSEKTKGREARSRIEE